MDLDVTSPKQLNRKLFLKQLAVDICTSERRILFRSQYVSNEFVFLTTINALSLFSLIYAAALKSRVKTIPLVALL